MNKEVNALNPKKEGDQGFVGGFDGCWHGHIGVVAFGAGG